MPLLAPVTIANFPFCGGMSATVHGAIGNSPDALLSQEKWPLFKKSGVKTFCYAGPVAVKPARPKLTKFFCFFLFTKSSLPSFLFRAFRLVRPAALLLVRLACR